MPHLDISAAKNYFERIQLFPSTHVIGTLHILGIKNWSSNSFPFLDLLLYIIKEKIFIKIQSLHLEDLGPVWEGGLKARGTVLPN